MRPCSVRSKARSPVRSFLFLVRCQVRPGAPSSVLVTNSKAPVTTSVAPVTSSFLFHSSCFGQGIRKSRRRAFPLSRLGMRRQDVRHVGGQRLAGNPRTEEHLM